MEEDISCTDLYYPAGLRRLLLYKKKHYGVTQMVKTFPSACLYHANSLLYSMLSRSLDSTVSLHEWWPVFTVCSMCTHRKQRLLFCLFVADRAWALLAVRPSIHKAILSLIDGDPLNYRLKQETAAKNNPCKSFLRVPYIQHVCTWRKKRMNVKMIPNAFFLISLSLSFWLSFFGQTLSSLAIILGRYQCVAASSDRACDKG